LIKSAFPLALNAPQLAKLDIGSCSNFKTLSGCLDQLRSLTITESTSLTILEGVSLPQLADLLIHQCKSLTTLKLFLPQLVTCRIDQCNSFTRLPDNLSYLERLTLSYCPSLTVLPDNLSRLFMLHIDRCDQLTILPGNLPDDLVLMGHHQIQLTPLGKIWVRLNYMSCFSSTGTNQELATLKEYFLSANKMWGTSEAKNNPAAFAEKQLKLLEQMHWNSELLEACFELALLGNSDCHDNAFAMFLKMQEKALEISMNKPGVALKKLIDYGLALENLANLKQLIENTPELKNGINGGEGTEAQLALQLLFHEKNIALPIPVTAMLYEAIGWEQFKGAEDGQLTNNEIKIRIGKLIDTVVPQITKPSAQFLANQPFWQAHLNQQNHALAEKTEAINAAASQKLDSENDKLFDDNKGSSFEEIEKNMKTLEQERKEAFVNLYLSETEKLLSQF